MRRGGEGAGLGGVGTPQGQTGPRKRLSSPGQAGPVGGWDSLGLTADTGDRPRATAPAGDNDALPRVACGLCE